MAQFNVVACATLKFLLSPRPRATFCLHRGFEVNEVIVSKSLGDKAADKMPWHEGRDSWFHELESVAPAVCEPEWVSAEHPLFMLYTSGSTGKPKGVLHSTGLGLSVI